MTNLDLVWNLFRIWHLPLGTKDGSLDDKRLGKSDCFVDGGSECKTLGVIEMESEGILLGIIEGVELGKKEGSTLGILLGIWGVTGDAVGVTASVTTSWSGDNGVGSGILWPIGNGVGAFVDWNHERELTTWDRKICFGEMDWKNLPP